MAALSKKVAGWSSDGRLSLRHCYRTKFPEMSTGYLLFRESYKWGGSFALQRLRYLSERLPPRCFKAQASNLLGDFVFVRDSIPKCVPLLQGLVAAPRLPLLLPPDGFGNQGHPVEAQVL